MQPGDALSLKPEAAHEPLVATLVISQAALGMALAQLGARYVLGPQ
jgi:hypothetical protein